MQNWADPLPSWHWVSSFEWGGNNIPTSKDGRNLLRCCLWESTIWDQPIVSASRAPYRALETQALGLNYNPGTQVFYNFHITDEANRGSGKLHFFFNITQLGGKWAGAQNLDYWFWTLASVYVPCASFSKFAVGHSLERVRKWLQGAWGYSPHLLRGRIKTTHLAVQKPKRQSPNSLASYERHPMVWLLCTCPDVCLETASPYILSSNYTKLAFPKIHILLYSFPDLFLLQKPPFFPLHHFSPR